MLEQYEIGITETVKGKLKELASCLCTIYNNGKATILVIDNVFVIPEKRNKGYGTKIINMAIDSAKNKEVDCIELVVNDDNEIAKNVYYNCGLRPTNKEHWRLILKKICQEQ